MLDWLRRGGQTRRTAALLYDQITEHAREPLFYARHGVPDSMEGRFEMIVLHLALVLERLRTEGIDGQKVGQALIERLVAEMDDALRQIGIGDMGVPRRIKKTAAAIAERCAAYRDGLDATAASSSFAADPVLISALARFLEAAGHVHDTQRQAGSIASYMIKSHRRLAGIDASELFAGRIAFASLDGGQHT